MKKIIILSFILALSGMSCKVKNYQFSHHVWINKDIEWINQEGNNYYSKNGRVLYFSENGEFNYFIWTLNKSIKTDTLFLSVEGGKIYSGYWNKCDNNIVVNYQLKSMAVKVIETSGTINTIIDTLNFNEPDEMIFNNQKYNPFEKFTKNDLSKISHIPM